MKTLTEKRSIKIIALILVFTIAFVTISPNYIVYGASVDETGGKLFKPICQLCVTIGDLVLQFMQWIFIGDKTIDTNLLRTEIGGDNVSRLGNDKVDSTNYVIRYGPALIFLNKVPALDANFINPKYTDANPYKVTAIEGYKLETSKTELLENKLSSKKQKNFDNFVNSIINIHNQSIPDGSVSIDENDLSFKFVADNKNFNEYSVQVSVGQQVILCEGRKKYSCGQYS